MSKQLYTLEFPVRCSPAILYEFLSTPAGLGEWFADKVDERDNIFYFGWNGSFDKAEVLETEPDKMIRFRWLHGPQDEYFEFGIEKSEITNQTILVVKDFAEKKEIKDQIVGKWRAVQQINKGDGLLILEAMKMENVLKASGTATVKAIKVDERTAVEKGTILIELE